MRPALFLFALLVPALLMGCRQQSDWLLLEGVALGTGYHITLNGDLSSEQRVLLEAAIQGELAVLDGEVEALYGRLQAGWPLARLGVPAPGAFGESLGEGHHALAVDRLTQVLESFSVAHGMVEVGGVVRTRGMAGRHPWRIALPNTGLAGAEDYRVRLGEGALVTRTLPAAALSAPADESATRLLAVSAVAESAQAADRLARRLLLAPPDHALEQPVRLVVLTPQGIELITGSALEPLLER